MNKNYYYFLPLLLFILYYINYIQTDIITNNIVVSSDDINDDGDIIEGMDPAAGSHFSGRLVTHRLNSEGQARQRRRGPHKGGRRAQSHRRAKSSARLALRKDAARSRAQRIITAGGRRCPAGR
jgi:hypothetical protein